jgi:inner membrane transporter RhtA
MLLGPAAYDRSVSTTRVVERSPAIALVATGAVSVQFGAALATKLFGRVGPAGAATLRLVIAALVLIGVVQLRARRAHPVARPATAADRAVAITFGVVLAAMNLSFYEAIARIPLGVAVTIEFSGPLAVALVGSRRWADGLWAVAAGGGVALLATGAGRHLAPAGLALAALAGGFWAGYILLSKETGRRFEALNGLAWAMTAGGLALLPFGLLDGGATLLRPPVLELGVVVAVLSSVIPYSLELLALRRVTPQAFGVMMSLDPALATAAGFVVLGQHLTLQEWAALALVVAANIGNTLTSRSGGLAVVTEITL